VIDHFGINCADFAKASAFYDEVLGVLGYSRQMDFGVAIYNAAIDLGAESLHEPRLWPEYQPNYFGAFVRDPDGNNVEAVCHSVSAGGAAAGAREG
jgi:catechol 2,3-dioxygenase-like lactoylglutathione lyase family enzyme